MEYDWQLGVEDAEALAAVLPDWRSGAAQSVQLRPASSARSAAMPAGAHARPGAAHRAPGWQRMRTASCVCHCACSKCPDVLPTPLTCLHCQHKHVCSCTRELRRPQLAANAHDHGRTTHARVGTSTVAAGGRGMRQSPWQCLRCRVYGFKVKRQLHSWQEAGLHGPPPPSKLPSKLPLATASFAHHDCCTQA